jgi:hypothetical protein
MSAATAGRDVSSARRNRRMNLVESSESLGGRQARDQRGGSWNSPRLRLDKWRQVKLIIGLPAIS